MENGLIYKKMSSIMAGVPAIGKSRKNQQQGFMYRGIDEVMNDLHSLFAKNSVFILPSVEEYDVDTKQTSKGGLMYRTHAKIRFRFVAEDGSFVETTNVGEAMDSGDKGMNKAMSVALKYSLMQMLLIPTTEDKDPDAVTPEATYANSTPPITPQKWEEIQKEIDEAKDTETLTSIYNNNRRLYSWEPFKELINKKYQAVKL